MLHKYTPEQKAFVKVNIKGRNRKEMTVLFNEHFGLNLGLNQITAFIKNNKFSSGLDSRFNPGHIPANKGVKGMGGWEPTQFKKGNRPANYRPVGTERVNTEGYVDIKIADPNKWKAKHRIIWEEANGPVPKGNCLVFGDGNKLNTDLDNLILVTRSQLARLNQNNLISNHADLTRTGLIVADIYTKISEQKKVNTPVRKRRTTK